MLSCWGQIERRYTCSLELPFISLSLVMRFAPQLGTVSNLLEPDSIYPAATRHRSSLLFQPRVQWRFGRGAVRWTPSTSAPPSVAGGSTQRKWMFPPSRWGPWRLGPKGSTKGQTADAHLRISKAQCLRSWCGLVCIRLSIVRLDTNNHSRQKKYVDKTSPISMRKNAAWQRQREVLQVIILYFAQINKKGFSVKGPMSPFAKECWCTFLRKSYMTDELLIVKTNQTWLFKMLLWWLFPNTFCQQQNTPGYLCVSTHTRHSPTKVGVINRDHTDRLKGKRDLRLAAVQSISATYSQSRCQCGVPVQVTSLTGSPSGPGGPLSPKSPGNPWAHKTHQSWNQGGRFMRIMGQKSAICAETEAGGEHGHVSEGF